MEKQVQEMRFRLENKDAEIENVRHALNACQRTKDQTAQKLNFNHERDL